MDMSSKKLVLIEKFKGMNIGVEIGMNIITNDFLNMIKEKHMEDSSLKHLRTKHAKYFVLGDNHIIRF